MLQQLDSSIRIRKTILSLEPYLPSESWINKFCSLKGITLKSPETIEEARRRYCNANSINTFFSKHSSLLQSLAPNNIWNADESSSASNRKYKVLLNDKNDLPLTGKPKIEPHITGMFCFNAVGERLDPFIILPNLVSLPNELKSLTAFFSTQKSGWMTKLLFCAFAIFFVSKVSQYRMRLPSHIANQPTLLIVDNHSSRFNSYAIEYLNLHNVMLLTLPPHCSHLLQPFDVAAAQSLKSLINKIKIEKESVDFAKTLPTKTAMARYLTVYSMIEAWRSVPSQVLINGFSHSGICPFNPAKPLSSAYVNPHLAVSNNYGFLLTSDFNRQVLYNNSHPDRVENVSNIPKIKYDTIYIQLTTSILTYGKILSYFPSLFVKTGENTYSKVFS